MIDFQERNKPEVFKPLIDKALIAMAESNGHSPSETSKVLKDLPADGLSNIDYLRKAAFLLVKWCYRGKVEELINTYGNWAYYLFNPPGFFELPVLKKGNDQEDASVFDFNEINPEDYPEEAQEALYYGKFLGGGQGDVLGVWKKDGINQIYLAFRDSFYIIAEDPVDWIQQIAEFVRIKMETNENLTDSHA
jgi:hypothetical protein